jgi:hypothetical protein
MLETISRVVTLVVTNVTKLAGLYVGVHEIGTHSGSPNAVVLAYSAFMMAGAQLSETTILALIEKFFGMKGGDK